MAVRQAAQREGQEEAAPRAGAHGAPELARRGRGIAEREVRDRDLASAAPGAEFLDPAVVGARVGERVAGVGRLGFPLEAEARVEERPRDAIVIEECQARGGVGRRRRRALRVAPRETRGRQLLEALPHATQSAQHLGCGEARGAAVDLEEVAPVAAPPDADRPGAIRGLQVALPEVGRLEHVAVRIDHDVHDDLVNPDADRRQAGTPLTRSPGGH